MVTTTTTTAKNKNKTGARRGAAAKKFAELEAKMAAFQTSLASLEEKTGVTVTPVTPVRPEPRGPFGLSERLLAWVTKNDMPTTLEVHRILWAGVNGTLEPEQEELALLIRELSAGRGCLLCGAGSHVSMAPGTPWSEVQLCKCAPMRARDPFEGLKKPKPKKGYVSALAEWPAQYAGADGGIAWVWGELHAHRLHPDSILYRKTCGCGAVFGIRAANVARAAQVYGLERYVESQKCLACATDAAARRRQQREEAHHTVPKKQGVRDLDDVLGRHIDIMGNVSSSEEVA